MNRKYMTQKSPSKPKTIYKFVIAYGFDKYYVPAESIENLPDRFRELYPEYAHLPDEVILDRLV